MMDARSEYISGYNDVEKRFDAEYRGLIDIDKALSAKWLDAYQGGL